MARKGRPYGRCASAQRLIRMGSNLFSVGRGKRCNRGNLAMSRFVQTHFHSAPVRAEMKALNLRERRLPFGTMMVSVIAGANTASVVAMLIGL